MLGFKMQRTDKSIRVSLDEIIQNKNKEQVILENLRRCSKIVGLQFKVIFWHKNLTQKEIKSFVKRNEHLLFEINTKITKTISDKVWYLIDSTEKDKTPARYKWRGDILTGIVQYIELYRHVNKEENR